MPAFFPVKTATFKLDEARAFRRISYSVIEMAVVTAVVLRVYRALALALAGANVFLLSASFAFGFVVLFGMVTRRATAAGGVAGMLVGVATAAVLSAAGSLYLWTAFWSFVAASVTLLAVSVMTSPKSEDELRGLVCWVR